MTKVLPWAREEPELGIVEDHVGSPTWARTLAEPTSLAIARAGEHLVGWVAERRGFYHLAGSGQASGWGGAGDSAGSLLP